MKNTSEGREWDVAKIKQAMQSENIIDFNELDSKGRTALSFLFEKNMRLSINLIKVLLDQNANIQSEYNGVNSLIAASLQCDVSLCQKIIDSEQIDINYVDSKGRSALYWAFASNDRNSSELVKLLINSGAHFDRNTAQLMLKEVCKNIKNDFDSYKQNSHNKVKLNEIKERIENSKNLIGMLLLEGANLKEIDDFLLYEIKDLSKSLQDQELLDLVSGKVNMGELYVDNVILPNIMDLDTLLQDNSPNDVIQRKLTNIVIGLNKALDVNISIDAGDVEKYLKTSEGNLSQKFCRLVYNLMSFNEGLADRFFASLSSENQNFIIKEEEKGIILDIVQQGEDINREELKNKVARSIKKEEIHISNYIDATLKDIQNQYEQDHIDRIADEIKKEVNSDVRGDRYDLVLHALDQKHKNTHSQEEKDKIMSILKKLNHNEKGLSRRGGNNRKINSRSGGKGNLSV